MESDHRYSLVVDATTGTLLGHAFLNLLLNVVTLGFWRFWGRTRVRRYLWTHVAVAGDRLEYSGTGRELFRGFYRAVLVLLPVGLAVAAGQLAVSAFAPGLEVAYGALTYLPVALLTSAARYSARRYRLSRTRWRGIRGTQVGSPWAYGWLATWSMLPVVLTLGLYHPYRWARLRSYELTNTFLGDRPLRFDGRGGDLLSPWLLTLLLIVPTVGLSVVWYQARTHRYLAAHMTFEGLSFAYPVSGAALLRRWLGDFVIVVSTLGVATPLVSLRQVRFLARWLQVRGTLDFATIAQSNAPIPSAGEGLLDLLDLGDI